MSTMIAILLTSFGNVLDAAFYAVYLLLIARFIMNFYVEKADNPGVILVFRFTEALLDPIRRKLGMEFRPLDLSLIIVFFSLIFIQGILVGMIRHLAVWFGG